MEAYVDQIEKIFKDGGLLALVLLIATSFAFTWVAYTLIRLGKSYLKKFSIHTQTYWDDFIFEVLDSTQKMVLGVWILYALTSLAPLRPHLQSMTRALVVIASTVQVIFWAVRILNVLKSNKLKGMLSPQRLQGAPVGLLFSTLEAVIVIILVMVGLSNFGIDIGALIAGLGIGGVAIALAAQNILGDLFASFSIIFDKPFAIGDYIQVGPEAGTVENIGLKTTRVKSLTGEQLVFSNKDLLESRIRNYKRMNDRRVALKTRVVYSTSSENLKSIPLWFKKIVSSQKEVRFEYCHFIEIADYSYVFETVFWINSGDGELYLRSQENIFHLLIDKFKAEGIIFAIPASALHIERTQNTPASP